MTKASQSLSNWISKYITTPPAGLWNLSVLCLAPLLARVTCPGSTGSYSVPPSDMDSFSSSASSSASKILGLGTLLV